MDAFDADVLIYAAVPGHPLGQRVRSLLSSPRSDPANTFAGIGSVILLPEVLAKPLRSNSIDEVDELLEILGCIELIPTTEAIADLATTLATQYKLCAADAVHLATAVDAGATRFITNNAKDFPKSITEIDITYPTDLSPLSSRSVEPEVRPD